MSAAPSEEEGGWTLWDGDSNSPGSPRSAGPRSADGGAGHRVDTATTATTPSVASADEAPNRLMAEAECAGRLTPDLYPLPASPPAALLAAAGSPLLDIQLPRSAYRLNLLVVGEPSCGKSSLIHNLFQPFAAPARGEGGPGAAAEAPAAPPDAADLGGRLSEFGAATPAADFRYSVLEVPALGCPTDASTGALCALVAGRDERYAEAWVAARSPLAAAAVPDDRFDVCLYLLPPHGLLGGGAARAVRRLSALLPVLPVLTKADSLTPFELAGLRQRATQELGLQGPLAWPADASLLAGAAGALGAAALPLAAVTSMENKSGVESFWPAREYPYGCVEVFNSPHSDVLALRKLLLEQGFFPLKAASGSRSGGSTSGAGAPPQQRPDSPSSAHAASGSAAASRAPGAGSPASTAPAAGGGSPAAGSSASRGEASGSGGTPGTPAKREAAQERAGQRAKPQARPSRAREEPACSASAAGQILIDLQVDRRYLKLNYRGYHSLPATSTVADVMAVARDATGIAVADQAVWTFTWQGIRIPQSRQTLKEAGIENNTKVHISPHHARSRKG